MTSTCRFCRFSVSLSAPDDFSCQRLPPTALYIGSLNSNGEAEVRSFWPTVSGESTCGEFILKPASLREAKLVEPIE